MRNARMVLREETLYRTEPQWSPDGKRMLYSSHRGSQYDNLYVLPVTEANPTNSHMAIGIISIRAGPRRTSDRLYLQPARFPICAFFELGGRRGRDGRDSPSRLPPSHGNLEVYLKDSASGPTHARPIYLLASDGKTYVPTTAYQRCPPVRQGRLLPRQPHFLVEVPAGQVTLEA